MIKKLQHKIQIATRILQRYTDRAWYPYLIGFLAAADNFIVIIPNDGILISSCMLAPRRWLTMAFAVSIGSTIGALALAATVQRQGLPWILELYPWLTETKMWLYSMGFFEIYGLYLVFAVALTPLAQQPAVILAGLANTPYAKLLVAVFVGRMIKYMIMAYLGSHAPRLLKKVWGVKGELEEVGIKIK